MTTAYYDILSDLQANQPSDVVQYPLPYTDSMSFEEKFNLTVNAVDRAKRMGDRTLHLVNSFYLGQLLEKRTVDNAQRNYYSQRLTIHHRVVAVRTFYLFEFLGVEQIGRATRTTPTAIRHLSQAEYQRLVLNSIEIFNGVENLRGE